MSVRPSDIVIYGSEFMPEDDVSVAGGGISGGTTPLIRVAFNDISPSGNIQLFSSNSGDTTQQITVTGRDAAGIQIEEAKTLNGQNAVAMTANTTWERLLKAVKDVACAGDVAVESATAVVTGTAQAGAAESASNPASITLQSGQGASVAIGMVLRITNNSPAGVQHQIRYIVGISGDLVYVNKDWSTVPTSATTYRVGNGMVLEVTPAEVFEVRRPFYNAVAEAAGGSNKSYHEKVFVKNNHATLALTSAQIAEQADPSGKVDFALESILNGDDSAANRLTAPGGHAFSNTTKNVANSQNLTAGSAQGLWLRFAANAGDAAQKTTYTPRTTGTTT